MRVPSGALAAVALATACSAAPAHRADPAPVAPADTSPPVAPAPAPTSTRTAPRGGGDGSLGPWQTTTPTPTPTPVPPDCTAQEVTVAVRARKPEYRSGDTVLFDITATNAGRCTCRVDVGGLYLRIFDPDGQPIQMGRLPGVPAYHPPGSPEYSGSPHGPESPYVHVLAPGAHVSEGCDWDGHVADPDNVFADEVPAPAGRYTVVAYWQRPRVTSAAAAFRIR